MRCLGCLIRRVVSSSSILPKVHPRRFSLLALLTFAALVCLGPAGARAQTAQFTEAVSVLFHGVFYRVAVDGSGNVYVGDTSNNAVKEIPASCIAGANDSSCVRTLGGGFNQPYGVAVDGSGNVYVADFSNNAVKEIPVSCIAGANDSSCVRTLGGGIGLPIGVAADESGNVYVASNGDGQLKEIPASCIAGVNNSSCVLTLSYVSAGYTAFVDVTVDGSGNLYAVDVYNNLVKKIPAGCASSSCVLTLGGGFNQPAGVAVDGSGNVYVADSGNKAVKEIPASCIAGVNNSSCVLTLAGGFNGPADVAANGSGKIYVTDSLQAAVKEIMLRRVDFGSVAVHAATPSTQPFYFTFTNSTPAAIGAPLALTMGACADMNAACANPTSNPLDFAVASGGTCTSGSTFSAGDTCTVNVTFTPQYAGARNGAVELTNASGAAIATVPVYGVGDGPQAVFNSPVTPGVLGGKFNVPVGMAVDGSGNAYVADAGNKAVKEIPAGCASSSCVLTLGGGFSQPYDVAVDGSGNIYVADAPSGAVKEIPASCIAGANDSGCVLSLGGGFSTFIFPIGVAVDGSGNVYVADEGNNAVKEIPASCIAGANDSSCVITLGGGFIEPYGVAVDESGNVYVGDVGNHAVREIPAGCGSSSCVLTLGSGFSTPIGMAVDGSGDVYVADALNGAVKEIPAGCASSSCVLTLGDGFSQPSGVAVDGSGNFYVADEGNNAVKEINRTTPPDLSFASTVVGATSADSPRTVMVQNIGNQPLTFPIPTSSGSYNPSVPANFSYSDSSTCLQNGASAATAFTLAPGASCTVAIDFAPVAPGSISGSAVLTNDSFNASAPNYTTQSISLSGTGIQAITQLAFSTAPPATITAGGNAGTIKVAEQDSGDATVATGTDSITLTVTGPNSYSQTYTATAVSGVASFDLSSVILNAAGSYTYTASSGSYLAATASVVVSKAATTTSLSASASSVTPGQSLTLTATVSSASAGSIGTPTGTVSFYDGSTLLGTGTLSGSAATYTTSSLAPGVTHSLTASYGGDTNFLASTSVAAVSVPVAVLDFSLDISGSQNQTVVPGGSANYSFQVTPTYGSYPGDVSFSVSGLPSGAIATFTPSTIAANGGAQTVTMTIQTQRPGTSAKNSNPFERGGGVLLLGFLFFPLLGIRRTRKALRSRSLAALLLLVAGLAGMASLSGCGTRNGFNGQAVENYAVTVTATSGGTQHSLGVNLNLQ